MTGVRGEVALTHAVGIPQLGFEVFQVPPVEAQRIVGQAREIGHRHFDTAAAYNNEAGVGAALEALGLPRDQVFVTTKLRNGEQGYESALRAYADSCQRLRLDVVDRYSSTGRSSPRGSTSTAGVRWPSSPPRAPSVRSGCPTSCRGTSTP